VIIKPRREYSEQLASYEMISDLLDDLKVELNIYFQGKICLKKIEEHEFSRNEEYLFYLLCKIAITFDLYEKDLMESC